MIIETKSLILLQTIRRALSQTKNVRNRTGMSDFLKFQILTRLMELSTHFPRDLVR